MEVLICLGSPQLEPIAPDGWWSWSLHPHADPDQQRRRARSAADLSCASERLGRCWKPPKSPKKLWVNKSISNISYLLIFEFICKVFAGTCGNIREHVCYRKLDFLSVLPSFNSWKLMGSPKVCGSQNKMPHKCLKKHQPQPVSLWISAPAQSTKKHHLQTFSSRAASNQPGSDCVQSGGTAGWSKPPRGKANERAQRSIYDTDRYCNSQNVMKTSLLVCWAGSLVSNHV